MRALQFMIDFVAGGLSERISSHTPSSGLPLYDLGNDLRRYRFFGLFFLFSVFLHPPRFSRDMGHFGPPKKV